MASQSIIHKLTGAMWLLSALSVVVAVGLSSVLLFRNAEQFASQNLRAAEANLISLGVLNLIEKSTEAELDPLIPKTLDSAQLSEIVRIFEARGKLIYANINLRDLPTTSKAMAKHVDRGMFIIPGQFREYYSVVRSYRAPNGKTYWLQIAAPRPLIQKLISQNLLPFSLMFLALLIISLLAARLVAGQSLSPLSNIMHHIDELDFDRIRTWRALPQSQVPRDFQPLVAKINELIVRSQRSLLKFHQFGRFIAHEVRTPLTIMQGEMETALMSEEAELKTSIRPILESALHEVSRIDQIVQTVLRLAARDRGKDPFKPEVFELKSYLESLLPEMSAMVGKPLVLQSDANVHSKVLLDKELLQLLLSNLFRNIARHTAPATKASFLLQPFPDGESGSRAVRMIVEDTGAGMSSALIEELNDPNAVGRYAGIGLSLCKEICAINKISLQFANRAEGGLRITMDVNPAP